MAYKNKTDQAASARRHYDKNKAACKARALAHKIKGLERNKAYVRNYLHTHPCVDCGERDVIVLEFDHVRGTKRGGVTLLMGSAVSLDTLVREIEKCDIRCANCHRRATVNRREKESGVRYYRR